MANRQMNKVVDYLRRAVLADGEVDLTDGQLLEHFVSHHDEAAVTALIRRHGPMVWGLCRRVLRGHHDAEDAFQATFLVFVRKAASITPKEMVANWLYGVAHQIALKARATLAKRRTREKQVMYTPEPKAETERELWRDLQPVLDQELSRLPDKYRVALILCDLEGKTRKEAARQLKIPEGTLSSRLATAKRMLAKRLARQGLAATGGSVTAVLSQKAALASVPASVLSSTIKAATLVATGKVTVAGLISTKAAALTEAMMKSMLLTKLVKATLLLLGMVILASGMLLAWGKTTDTDKNVEKSAANAEKQAVQQRNVKPPKYFTNSVGMTFVWIPPGTFMMGSLLGERERLMEGGHEIPGELQGEIQHKVALTKGFYMGVYTVTQEQWLQVMGENPSKFLGRRNLPVERVPGRIARSLSRSCAKRLDALSLAL